LVKNEFFPKFDDTEWFVENLWIQLRWKGQLENRIGILSLDTFLWIFIEFNSLSTFENWWKTKKLLAVNVLKLTERNILKKDYENPMNGLWFYGCLCDLRMHYSLVNGQQ
jgi:hypothetical protein